jgi:phage tail sheath gpL-like
VRHSEVAHTGGAIVTPSMIKSELISEYQTVHGLVEDTADFIQNLLVERDDTDPRRRLFSKATVRA